MWTVLAELAFLLFAPQGIAAPTDEKQGKPEGTVFTATANLVSLDVSVIDDKGKAIDGLRREDFQVYEASIQQNVVFFSRDKKPVSWGLVLDRSGSMLPMMDEVYNAALHSVEAGTSDDETFVVAFNSAIDVIQDFTSDRERLRTSARSIFAGGSTALYDAVAFAVNHVKKGRHQKKVLVVVTDGEDNSSQIKFRELLEIVRRSEAIIYTVGLFESWDWFGLESSQSRTKQELGRLAEQTGGMAYFPKNMKQCDRACRDIAVQVSRQYSVGYYPKDTAWDGKWRDVAVTLARPGHSTVRARQGYFARPPGSD